jgi:hypothetical protein
VIRFILGEDRHVKYFVHSVKGEYFCVKEASFCLLYDGKVEASGECEVTPGERGCVVDSKILPERRSRKYELEITLHIADEIIKNREPMEVV